MEIREAPEQQLYHESHILMTKKKTQKAVSRKHVPVLHTGTFSAASAGFGFVKPQHSAFELFVPRQHVNGAIDGDLVEYEEVRDTSGFHGSGTSSTIARITSVLEHSREWIVGCLTTAHSMTPLDKHLPESIRLNSVPRNAKRGDWVCTRLLNDGPRHTETLRGTVEQSLGPAGEIKNDLDAIVAEFHLMPPYTPEEEAAALKLKPIELPREDLTKLYTITIDPADAHDFDDAISISPGEKDTEIILGVHIADVAAWIHTGSKLDKAAAKRAFSAYLPGRFLPMLPRTLTAQVSLREKVVSAAHSVLFTIRLRDGKILKTHRCHSLVKVNKRLTSDAVQAFFAQSVPRPKGWTAKDAAQMELLHKVVKKLRARRAKTEQFLWIDTNEVRVLCDEETYEIKGLINRRPTVADGIVEECMLAANSAVAVELLESQIAGLFRVHPEPDPRKLEEFSVFVMTAFGISTGDLASGRKACEHFLESLPDDSRKPVILSRFLRTMSRAGYSATPMIHFGLGKLHYSHFTSPIRRYSDLAVHQQLLAHDQNKRLRSLKTFFEIAEDCSRKEERNDNAYFAASDRMKLHFLKQSGALEGGVMYEGVIQKIQPSGLLCDIPELGLIGTVSMDRLHSGGYRASRSRTRASSSRSHTEYRPGDFIYLALDTIDFVRGTASFRPVV